jgi:dienelactone hydrolase
MARGAALAVTVLALAGCGRSDVRLTAGAADDRLDAPVQIRAAGLDPHQRVTLVARTRDEVGRRWSSTTTLRADARGRLQPGAHPMRFLEAMRAADTPWFALPQPRLTVDLELRVGADVLARTRIERRTVTPDVTVRRLTVARDGRAGTYFAPRGERHPAVLLFGGSEGGDGMRELAGLLASHGLTVLTVAYFHAPGRPPRLRRIPLEYFRDAARWLRAQPGVDPRRVAVAGTSRGGEAALLVASTYPRTFWRTAALVPSAYVYGSPDDSAIAAWNRGGKPVRPGPRIPVERIRGPLLTIGAGEDAEWPSDAFVQTIAEHRRGRHDVRLDYPHAGHSAGAPVPFVPDNGLASLGGDDRATADARADAFPRLVRFLGGR